jgi:hypothetical protein
MRNDLAVPGELAEAGRKSDKKNRGELECLRIMTAENGYSVEARFEAKIQPRDGNPRCPEPELTVFQTLEGAEGLFAYIKNMLTGQVEYEKGEK